MTHEGTPNTSELPSAAELARIYFPTPEDWIALQGGKPRVFRNPVNPEARWVVLHVYDEHDDAIQRFQNGSIVDTLPPVKGVEIGRFSIERDSEDEFGHTMHIHKDIRVPTIMVNRLHGGPCSDRSSAAGNSGGYDCVANQRQYEGYINRLRGQGMQEMRFGVTDHGYAMAPLPKIRNVRPLHEADSQESE